VRVSVIRDKLNCSKSRASWTRSPRLASRDSSFSRVTNRAKSVRVGKDGVRLGIITNSFTRVAQSAAGADLLANISTKFVGRIEAGSIEPLSQSLGIPRELVSQCASNKFYTNRKEGYSNWLIQDYAKHTMGRWYAPWESVVLSASNANERNIKQWFFDRIPDKHSALNACTRYFRDCWQTGQDLVVPQSVTQVEQIIAEKLC
jgi:hypothetical protein